MSRFLPLLYSTPSYQSLAAEVQQLTGFVPGRIERTDFPDGEHYHRITDSIAGRHVILLGGTISDADTLQIYDLACAMVEGGVRALTLVIPYFGYSTMERAVRPGEVVTAKARARLLSSIPAASWGNRIVLLDLHVPGLMHYFEEGVRPFHLYAQSLVTQAARAQGGDDFVLACTDSGRAKWVESLANHLGVEASFVFKRRLDGERVEVSAVSARVAGKKVVIYDDMIRTGGSLLQAAQAYHAAGATQITAVTTHGIFPGKALDKLRNSGLISQIACTNSHPRALELAGDFLQVYSVADLLSDYLRESLSE
jgi:ribose-phosphate pyrophosphokinase